MSKKEQPQILCSVIVLTYKQLNWLPQVLKSITDQDYSNIEIIIADDGTAQFNYAEIEQLCALYCQDTDISYKVLHFSENQGTVKNFNNGILHSSGDIIIPMAGDNQFYDKSVISSIVKSYLTVRWNIATGKQMLCREQNVIEIRPYSHEINMIKKAETYKLAIRLAIFPCFIGGAATVYTRNIFEKFGYFNESYKLLEDCPFYVQLLLAGEKIDFIDNILIRHNVDGGGAKRNIQLIKDDIKVLSDLQITNKKMNFKEKRLLRYRKYLLEKEAGLENGNKNLQYIDCHFWWLVYRIKNKIGKEISLLRYKKI